jgi:hypothetical protein
MSYQGDIAHLLREAIATTAHDGVAAPRVRETLRQYIDLLETLAEESL